MLMACRKCFLVLCQYHLNRVLVIIVHLCALACYTGILSALTQARTEPCKRLSLGMKLQRDILRRVLDFVLYSETIKRLHNRKYVNIYDRKRDGIVHSSVY